MTLARRGGPIAAARELRALVGELTEASWLHPAWLVLIAGTALLETLTRVAGDPVEADPYSAYLAANGSPRSDTFMARDRATLPRDAAERIALAVVRAVAAVGVLRKLDGALPGQPLARALRFERGWLQRVPLDATRAAVFVTPRGRYVAELSEPEAVARALGRACAGGGANGPMTELEGPGAAAVTIDLSPQPLSTARHLHRRAWTADGGPWLGLGHTEELELVTTCHLVVDGYGHGRVAGEVFDAIDAAAPELARLAGAARAGLGSAEPRFPEAPAVAGALPIGFASRVIPADKVRFPRVAYAIGRTLERLGAAAGGEHSPTVQGTVAPGERGDAERRRRRVRFALMALHREQDGGVESFDAFRVRLTAAVARENAHPGLLSRVLGATANAPLPRGLRRRLLSSEGRPNRLVPPIAVLAGRASLSLIRYPEEECPRPPLYAASSPGLLATEDDPFGSFVVTIVHHGAECTVSLDGTGVAGTREGARRVLEMLLEEIERV